MKFFGKKSQSGFSLVELMIVVGIIGVLATLALPRFKQFQAKAKMAEAQNVLQHVYTLEQSYSLDNNMYLPVATAIGATTGSPTGAACVTTGNATALGLKIEPCVQGTTAPTPRFSYTVNTPNSAQFQAVAQTGAAANNRICPGNPQFVIALNDQNASANAVGATVAYAANNGLAQINAVCPN